MQTTDFLEDLLPFIEERLVVPIIGHGLLTVEWDGKTAPLQQVISERLAKEFGLPEDGLPPAFSLNETVCRILEKNYRHGDIYPKIKCIVDKLDISPPSCLTKLAQIRHFNLFITTTYDSLLETAINNVRYGGEQKTRVLAYDPKNLKDLPKKELSERTTVFHLMGKASPLPNSFAVTDEDILEFICSLQERRPQNLFDVLKDSYLLILGSEYPDWLARFFMRTTKSKKLSLRDDKDYLVDTKARNDVCLVHFLSHFSKNTEIYLEGGPTEFIDLLHAKWIKRNPTQSRQDDQETYSNAEVESMPVGAIFISYAIADLKAARNLKERLELHGLDVWFDKEQLMVGDNFDHIIRKNIKSCSLFVPLLSYNSISDQESYFRREWKFAIDRTISQTGSAIPFILPVLIDDTDPYCDGVPEEFQGLHCDELPEGYATDRFINRVIQLFKKVQKAERGLL